MTNVRTSAPELAAGVARLRKLARSGVVLLCFAVLLPRLASLYSMNLFDDAFITFRHSQQLVAGEGLTYNAGTRTLGTTAPLFALMLALPGMLGITPLTAALAIGITSDVLTGVVTYSLLAKRLGRPTATTVLVLFALDPHIIRISVGGMESSLFLFLSVCILGLLERNAIHPALLLASVCPYLRPEGVVLWMICLTHVLASQPKGQRHRSLAAILLAVALSLIPLALMYAYYGTVVPQSVIAKGHKVGSSLAEVLHIFLFPSRSPLQTALTFVAPVGLMVAWRRSRYVRLACVWAGLYLGAYLVARPEVWTWYALPVYFVKSLLGGIGFWYVFHTYIPLTKKLSEHLMPMSAAASILVAVVMLIGVGRSPVQKHIYEPLASWCETIKPGDTIAAGDIGAVGYYCRRAFIYDLAGLVWPERRVYRTHLEVITSKKPDYILAETVRYWGALYEPQSPLHQQYEPITRFSPSGSTDVTLSASELAPRWRQDYVLFKRVKE